MTGQGVFDGFELDEMEGAARREQSAAEAWLHSDAGRRLGDGALGTAALSQFFLESYETLKATGWAWREAFCIAWLSLGRDDRGGLETVNALCDFLGVSRMWYYEHKARYDNEPARGLNAWDWWAERLQLARLRGSRLAEVDEAVYQKAVSGMGKAADRELYYKRAGVLVNRSEVSASIGQTVDVAELTDDELDALLARDRQKADRMSGDGTSGDDNGLDE